MDQQERDVTGAGNSSSLPSGSGSNDVGAEADHPTLLVRTSTPVVDKSTDLRIPILRRNHSNHR
jgi:hypothetical protein